MANFNRAGRSLSNVRVNILLSGPFFRSPHWKWFTNSRNYELKCITRFKTMQPGWRIVREYYFDIIPFATRTSHQRRTVAKLDQATRLNCCKSHIQKCTSPILQNNCHICQWDFIVYLLAGFGCMLKGWIGAALEFQHYPMCQQHHSFTLSFLLIYLFTFIRAD